MWNVTEHTSYYNSSVRQLDINLTSNTSLENEASLCGSDFIYKKQMVGTEPLLFIGIAFSVLVITLNSLLVSILLRKNNISTINILLAVLGISDAVCCFFMYQPIFIGYLFGILPINGENGMLEDVPGFAMFQITYPFCIIIEWSYVLINSSFHALSVILTTLLGLIKALVLLFPMKSRIFITNKLAWFSSLLAAVFAFSFHAPYGFMKHFRRAGVNTCCIDPSYRSYFPVMSWIIVVMYISSFTILISSTTYICLKLTVWKKKIQSSEAQKNVERNRRSAMIVTAIVFIFFISETPNALCFISMTFIGSGVLCSSKLRRFYEIVVVVGYASNFFIYWAMSNNLRSQLFNHLKRFCYCKNPCKKSVEFTPKFKEGSKKSRRTVSTSS